MNECVCLEGMDYTPPSDGWDGELSAGLLRQAMIAGETRRLLDEAWKANERFDRHELLRYVDVIDALVAQEGPATPGCSMREEWETLLAVGLIWRDEAENALRLARALLTRTATPRFRLVLLTVVRYAFWRMRKLDAFYDLPMPRHHGGRLNMRILRVVNLSLEAAAEAEQLRLKLAERNAGRALELAEVALGVDANAALLSRCVLSVVAYEMGELEKAHALIRGRDAAIDQYGFPDAVLWGITVASRIAIANDQRKQAMLVIRQGQAVCRQRGWARLRAHFEEQEIDLLIKERNLVQAQHVLERVLQGEQLHAGPGLTEAGWPLEAARLRVALAAGAYAEASAGGGARESAPYRTDPGKAREFSRAVPVPGRAVHGAVAAHPAADQVGAAEHALTQSSQDLGRDLEGNSRRCHVCSMHNVTVSIEIYEPTLSS